MSLTGSAYGTLASVECMYYWEWEKAEEVARTGVERDPNSFLAWVGYANVLCALGRREECMSAVERYVELDPLSVFTLGYASFHCWFARRFDEAWEYAKRCEQIDSGFWGVMNLVAICQCRGEDDKALEYVTQIEAQWDAVRRSNGAALLAYTLGRSGRPADFRESVEGLEHRIRSGTATWTELALAHVGANDHESALDCLEKAPERPPGGDFTAWVGVFPHFDPIRKDPRFRRVLEQLGLA